jgi:glycosyltransferase involved in cell wall biosynthesis
MKEKKILAMFDYIATTGFGTVSNNLVRELKKYFGSNIKLDIIAINYFGEGYWEDENTYVQSGKLNDIKEDDFGRYWFLKKLQDNDYDGVFILQDLGVVSPILEIVKYIKDEKREANRKQFKTIFYFPIDCNLGIPQLLNNIEYCDLLVAYTKFGKNEVLKIKPELKNKIRVVPHGNNPKDFYPLPQEEIKKFRKEFYGENADKFIITNVNRNQPRKDIGNTIFGFIEAKKNWDASLPKPFLYLHCHPQDPMGNDLRVVLNQSELIEDIDYKLLPKEFEKTMVDIEFLNKIYNATDVYVSTTLGEGWGLSFSEAASCKIPIIASYSTSFMEMSNYGKNAWMLETLYPYLNLDNIIREQTDIYELADRLLEVAKGKYSNSKEFNDKIERSYQWAKSLDWSLVCKLWIEYFKEIYKLEKK